MSGLNTSLSIGLQALEVTQGALEAASNNIANANTPGYTREIPQFSEVGQTLQGEEIVGGGVTLDSLQSVRDELLNLQIQQQTSQQASADTASSNLQQVQNYFASSSGQDISSELTAFSSSLAQLSATPTNSAARQSVLSSGQNLAHAFNSTASGLASAQSEADGQVTQTVSQINSLSSQIAQLNGQLAQLTQKGQDGGAIQDQRDQLVQQLSGLTGIAITQNQDGSGETITTGNGTPLVIGSQSFTLQTATGSNSLQKVLDSNGNDVTSTIQGGQLGGAIEVRDTTIPGFTSQLNTLATQFATAFNTAQTQGFDSSGNAGQNFFTLPANSSDAAAGISVALTDPSQIAASSDGSAGSNGNVANLTAALTGKLPSGETAAGAYANLVFQVGSAASDASTQLTAIGQNLQQLQNQQSSVSGVNVDEETTNLIRYQTAYSAAARIIDTIQQLNTITLNLGGSETF
ncbi:MAG TPA: flagellar hook-associated protein FlgK [Acidobacteriaceae bacterium]|jgi:flagellar hook-associated protein 1 FlgK|nr:flagellar hook-associated protein FlgK [Acidobacteriaceae bacterium]